jgi:hypothetical protein
MAEKKHTTDVPFPRSSELCKDLDAFTEPAAIQRTVRVALHDANKAAVPGEPWLDFDLSSQDLRTFVLDELLTPGLDRLSPYLWLVSTPRSDHISSLHQQIVKGRQITIAENPELHLTWMYNQVYLKPMPECLLSWKFWALCLTAVDPETSSSLSVEERKSARASAIGFVRSYSHLILHASDYRVAIERGLIQRHISYAAVRRFLLHFRKLEDTVASKRYQFGELRLRRVNFWGRFFLRRFIFQKVQVHYNYNAYFTRFYGPMIFLFAFFSTTLSAMQVELASNVSPASLSRDFRVFVAVCKWYSVCTVLVATALLGGLVLLLIYMILRELVFASKFVCRKRRRARKMREAA